MLPTLRLLALLLLAAPAGAVLIDSGDGTGNTSAPVPDPGWDNVGVRVGVQPPLSAVYLGNGYVITAAHAGFGDVQLGGILHTALVGTDVLLQNPDSSLADLRLFAIHPVPALPALPISLVAPAIGEDLVLAGNGRDRGLATSFDPNGPLPPGPIGGYLWGASQTLRWGTNQVTGFELVETLPGVFSEAFSASFDAGGSPHEGIATTGDSGGAVFHENGGQWELAGIMVAVSIFNLQPANTSLYGNVTYVADLAFYRDDIQAELALPEPAGGLWWGAVALFALSLRRRR